MYLLRKYIAVRLELLDNSYTSLVGRNKTLKNQKIIRKYPILQRERNYLMIQTRDEINNRAVGLMANGVELFPPTVFDEQIFHGDITSIKVTNPGTDYDVITGPPLIINDSQGTGAIAHANVVWII